MITDLSRFAWRMGLAMIVALPLLYLVAVVAPFASGGEGQDIIQFFLALQMILPSIAFSIGFGCVLLLLVRIERHLRKDDEV